MSQQTTAKKLYDVLTVRNFEDLKALDSRTSRPPVNDQGQPDVGQADMFSFDWTAHSGRNYGTAVILLTADNELDLYFGDNLGRGMEPEDKQDWYDFLLQIKQFATKNFLEFNPQNVNRLKFSLAGQAAINEGLFESWRGTATTSWNAAATQARIMVRHKRPLGENDARYRCIDSMFIETADGERYRLPFVKLSGARAMLEHVRQGGRPYDTRGQHIAGMVEEINVLSRFRRAVRGQVLEGVSASLVEQTSSYYQDLARQLTRLHTARGYQQYFESWSPAQVSEQDIMVEDLRNMFVEQSIDTRIEAALPVLARIHQGKNMKEVTVFEQWVNGLVEGTWSLPDTPKQQQQLIELMSKEFPVGADAVNAAQQLYGLIGDDELFDRLGYLADQNADADARPDVAYWMSEHLDNPVIAAVYEAVPDDVKPEAFMPPAQDSAVTEQQHDTVDYDADLDSILKSAGVPAKEKAAPDYQTGVAEGVSDIDTSGYTKYDMDFVDHRQNQIKKIHQKLIKIPGFLKMVRDPAEQLELAEAVFNWMKKGQTFNSALALAQQRTASGRAGVTEATGDNQFDTMMGKISQPAMKQAEQQRKRSTIQSIADALCNDLKCDYNDLTDQDLQFISSEAGTSMYDVMSVLGKHTKPSLSEQGVAEGKNIGGKRYDKMADLKGRTVNELTKLIQKLEGVVVNYPDHTQTNEYLHLAKMIRAEKIGKKGRPAERVKEQDVAEAAKYRDPEYFGKLHAPDAQRQKREKEESDAFDAWVASTDDFIDPVFLPTTRGYDEKVPLGRDGKPQRPDSLAARRGLPGRKDKSGVKRPFRAALKTAIGQDIGKHHNPNLPEQGVAEGQRIKPGDRAVVTHPDPRHVFHNKTVKVDRENSDGTYHVSTHWNDGYDVPASTLMRVQKQLKLKLGRPAERVTEQGVAESAMSGIHLDLTNILDSQDSMQALADELRSTTPTATYLHGLYDTIAAEYNLNPDRAFEKILRKLHHRIQQLVDQPVDEAKSCNMSESGTMCPEHGLAECGMSESVDPDMTRLKSLLGRI
jgi:hypothetical protein